jgi:hypothetical protein
MRDRSGRSGRRRGSQKPGTAAPRGKVTPSCANSGAGAVKPASETPIRTPISRNEKGTALNIAFINCMRAIYRSGEAVS